MCDVMPLLSLSNTNFFINFAPKRRQERCKILSPIVTELRPTEEK